MPGPLVELRDLSKSYLEGDREHAVLRDAAGHRDPASWWCWWGAAARASRRCSTCSPASICPSSGEVVIDGVACRASASARAPCSAARHIGFVFQFFNLIPPLTVEENLLLPLELNGEAGRGRAPARRGRC